MKGIQIGFAGLTLFALVACLNSIKPQDREFISKIKRSLRAVGDTVRVADVHSGDWLEVCVNPLGANTNIEVKHIAGEGLRSNGIEIINNANTYADDDVWGIYFRYSDNRAEYYRIPWVEMNGGTENLPILVCRKNKRCLKLSETLIIAKVSVTTPKYQKTLLLCI